MPSVSLDHFNPSSRGRVPSLAVVNLVSAEWKRRDVSKIRGPTVGDIQIPNGYQYYPDRRAILQKLRYAGFLARPGNHALPSNLRRYALIRKSGIVAARRSLKEHHPRYKATARLSESTSKWVGPSKAEDSLSTITK
jgi:hypothetical protein